MANPSHTHFNVEQRLKELNDRFKHVVNSNFPANNRKGTERYDLEVNFAYAINDVRQSPVYMQGKMFDKAASIVSRLIASIKKETAAA